MRAGALAGAVAVLAGAVPAGAAGASAPPLASLGLARLQGFYAVTGVVTKAVGVPGEDRGEHVSRTWAFIPPASCLAAQCGTVELVRTLAIGTDKLVLHRRRPAFYSGVGSFVAPVRCNGHLYRKGEQAKFTLTVQITAATVQGTLVQAAGFKATYTGRVRTGLTPCVTAPSYDAARYVGAAPAIGAIRRVARTRSSTAS